MPDMTLVKVEKLPVARLLKQHHISQGQVAKAAAMSQSTVSGYMRGHNRCPEVTNALRRIFLGRGDVELFGQDRSGL
jgi:transcriptional regulator with XRE-family HTH domain